MKRILTAACLFCLSSPLWAFHFSFFAPGTFTEKKYIGAGAGYLFNHSSGNNYLATGDGWPDDHYSSSGIGDQPYALLTAGYLWQRNNDWFPSYSVGLRYMYTKSATLSGYMDQYSLAGFRNYHYSYNVQLLNLLAVFKANLYRWHQWMPYVIVGAGVTNYSTSEYKEEALSGVTPRVSPAFGGHSENNFTYQVGIGLDYMFTENAWMNIEFDYADYGTIETGKGVNYATLTGTNYDNESLRNKLESTTAFIGFTYNVG